MVLHMANTGVRYDKKLRLRARSLRQNGKAIKVIARELGISVGTSHLWTHDVLLNSSQIEKLGKAGSHNLILGRAVQRERKRQRIKVWTEEADKQFEQYKVESFFMLGLGLYWGEGEKTSKRLVISSVTFQILQIWMAWCRRYVPSLLLTGSFRIHIGNDVNKAHRFWRKKLGISMSAYRSWPKKNNKRIKWPFGVGRVSATGKGSTEWSYKVLRWIELASVVQK